MFKTASSLIMYSTYPYQAKLVHADLEVRLMQEPFPLYPGETLETKVTKLRAVPTNTALRLRAIADFTETDNVKRYAHDEWLFVGPGESLIHLTHIIHLIL